jgi:hypothetical protein
VKPLRGWLLDEGCGGGFRQLLELLQVVRQLLDISHFRQLLEISQVRQLLDISHFRQLLEISQVRQLLETLQTSARPRSPSSRIVIVIFMYPSNTA